MIFLCIVIVAISFTGLFILFQKANEVQKEFRQLYKSSEYGEIILLEYNETIKLFQLKVIDTDTLIIQSSYSMCVNWLTNRKYKPMGKQEGTLKKGEMNK